MSALIVFIIGVLSIVISKIIFKKWYNHLSLYSIIWMFMIMLFEAKLLPYHPLSNFTWFVIAGAFFSFILGVFVINTARSIDKDVNEREVFVVPDILADDGKTIKSIVYITGIIGLIFALTNWYVLVQKFGSIVKVLIAANSVYRMRVDGELEGLIPYTGFISYIGICLAGVYTAYKGKLTIAAFLPVFAFTLKSLSEFSRIGMLMALVEFLAAFILFRHFVGKKLELKAKMKLLLPILVVLIMIGLSASMIRAFRGTYEKYKGVNKELGFLKDNIFFSPSVYLYLSSHVGVLNKYLEKDEENYNVGENTFAAFYNFLAKANLTKRVPFDLRGYYIPMWTNTGTFLRDLHGDYGIFGIFLIPFVLGASLTFFWYQFYEKKKIIYFILLVYFYMVINISFFSLIMRGADWFLSLFIFFWLIPFIERRAIKRSMMDGLKIEE